MRDLLSSNAIQKRPTLPEARTLAAGLTALLCRRKGTRDTVSILRRRPNLYASTFPSEIVTCLLTDGSKRRLLCKYASDECNGDYGHRGGVEYEANVYRHVLRPLRASTPKFYGLHRNAQTGDAWLVLEYLAKCPNLIETHETEGEFLAARWIGRFHAANEDRLASASLQFLNRYDDAYYLGWARRTARIARPWRRRFPWLETVCNTFREIPVPLLVSSRTVIHGEYYPLNILTRGGVIHPIDWESAAIAAGEIDLASLTEAWSARHALDCEREYRQARWPHGAPAEFERRLLAARLYLAFRWLADESDRTHKEPRAWYLKQLRSTAERLEMI